MVGAIVLAAGSGTRMQAGKNKQFLSLGSDLVLGHSLKAFANHKRIAGLVVVARAGEEEAVAAAVEAAGCRAHVKRIVTGGAERQDSVRMALAACPDDWRFVLIHDGARPLVSAALIERLVDALDAQSGVIPVLRIKDTVKEVDAQGQVVGTVDRSRLVLAQTPQGFPLTRIRQAHQLAFEQGLKATDDASLFEALHWPVRTLPGEARNLKITVPEDLLLAEWYRHEGERGCE